jgi:hypothetical protein
MADHDDACRSKGIPDHLHQIGRPTIQNVGTSEFLYYRFQPDKLKNGKLSLGIFRIPNMSVLWRRFCKSPDDALFDGVTGQHFPTWGVIQLPVSGVEAIACPPNANIQYELKVVHDPLLCMYPHTEVRVFGDGHKLDVIDPQLKTLIKDCLRDLCTLAQPPS